MRIAPLVSHGTSQVGPRCSPQIPLAGFQVSSISIAGVQGGHFHNPGGSDTMEQLELEIRSSLFLDSNDALLTIPRPRRGTNASIRLLARPLGTNSCPIDRGPHMSHSHRSVSKCEAWKREAYCSLC